MGGWARIFEARDQGELDDMEFHARIRNFWTAKARAILKQNTYLYFKSASLLIEGR